MYQSIVLLLGLAQFCMFENDSSWYNGDQITEKKKLPVPLSVSVGCCFSNSVNVVPNSLPLIRYILTALSLLIDSPQISTAMELRSVRV